MVLTYNVLVNMVQ